MPPVVGLAGAIAGSVVSSVVGAAVGSALVGSIVGAVATFAIGFIGQSIFGSGSSATDTRLPFTRPAQNGFLAEARERTVVLRSSVAPRNRVYGTAKLGGVLVFAASTPGTITVEYDRTVNDTLEDGSTTSRTEHVTEQKAIGDAWLHLVIALTGHEIDAVSSAFFWDEEIPASWLDGDGNVTAGRFAGHARIRPHLGAADQAADPLLVADCAAAGWTGAHRLRGCGHVYVRLLWNDQVFATGIPQMSFLVRGAKVHDPRTGATAWSNNWALCVRDYLRSADGAGAEAGEIDDASIIAAANISDEAVAIAGGSQPRYTCDGVIVLDQEPLRVLERLVAAGAGILVWSQGAYRLHAGAWRPPTLRLTAADLRDDLRILPRPERRDLFNQVRGTFVDPAKGWQPGDFPPVANAMYEAEDGEPIATDLELAFTDDAVRAQRIARIWLEKSRQAIRVEWPGKFTCLRVAVGQPVLVDLPDLGWHDKAFMPVDWGLAPDGGVDLVLQEEAAACYDWAMGMATVLDPAPDTSLPNPFTVAVPVIAGADSGTARLLRLGDGSIISRILVMLVPATDVFVRARGSREVRYRQAGMTAWDGPVVVPGDQAAAWLAPVADGATYEIQARDRNQVTASAWSAVCLHRVIGKTAPPARVLAVTYDGASFRWTLVPIAEEPDRAGVLARFHYGQSHSWNDAAPFHDGVLTASPWQPPFRPPGQISVLFKAVDTTGNVSDAPAVVITDFGDPVVANIVEDTDFRGLGFPGAIEGGTIDGGDLVAGDTEAMWGGDLSASMWDGDLSEPMWPSLSYGVLTYAFALLPSAAAAGSALVLDWQIAGQAIAIDYRIELPEPMWDGDLSEPMWPASAPMWDGDLSEPMAPPDALALPMWPDLPAIEDAPMWPIRAPWQPWPGAVTAQPLSHAFRIPIGAGPQQGAIRALTAIIDVPDRVAVFADQAIAAAGTVLPLPGARALKYVNLALNDDGGTAAYPKVVDDDPAHLTIRVFDAAHAATTGHVFAQVGYY